MKLAQRYLLVGCCLSLVLLGSGAARAQFIQGTDLPSLDPSDWTRTIIDKGVNSTVTFELNPCEYAMYLDANQRPRSCKPRPVDCALLNTLASKLQASLNVWSSLATDALTLDYGGIVGGGCVTDVSACPVDIWEDDNQWVVTRTYSPTGPLGQECGAGQGMQASQAGAGLRLYDDASSDNTTRSVRECDIVFFSEKWDNTSSQCGPPFTSTECAGAWKIALSHEIGHCLGFSHSYLTRRTLELLGPFFTNMGLELTEATPSIMSYDRIGSVDVFNQGALNTYDEALYLYSYADDPDPSDGHFAAHGTVSACSGGVEIPLYGAAVFALAIQPAQGGEPEKLTPVHLSLTGADPLLVETGEFRLDHLRRGHDYRLLVVDTQNAAYMQNNGWNFNNTPSSVPGLPVFRTDLWDEVHSGNTFKREISDHFATGFALKITDPFSAPALPGDVVEFGRICVAPE